MSPLPPVSLQRLLSPSAHLSRVAQQCQPQCQPLSISPALPWALSTEHSSECDHPAIPHTPVSQVSPVPQCHTHLYPKCHTHLCPSVTCVPRVTCAPFRAKDATGQWQNSAQVQLMMSVPRPSPQGCHSVTATLFPCEVMLAGTNHLLIFHGVFFQHDAIIQNLKIMYKSALCQGCWKQTCKLLKRTEKNPLTCTFNVWRQWK